MGAPARIRIRARDVSIALGREHKTSILNVFAARVGELLPVSAAEVLVRLSCPDASEQAVLARLTKKSADEMGLRHGLDVYARVKGVSVR